MMIEPTMKRDDPAQPERTKAGHKRLGNDQHNAQHYECEARVVHRDDLQRIRGEQQADDAYDAGHQ